jgi:hypothetical protein
MDGLNVFFSYSHEDEDLRKKLEVHLTLLKRQGKIRAWHDRLILPGKEWAKEIDENLETADVVLLLVSPDFVASEYCWDVEMSRALERHKAGTARVIPILLRPVDWSSAPFAKLQALPKNARPITTWTNLDEAFLSVAEGLRAALEDEQKRLAGGPTVAKTPPAPTPSPSPDLLNALASVFDTEAAAVGLLERVGVPRMRLPSFGQTTPIQFWEAIGREAEKGLIAGGLATVLREAAKDYPHNPRFQQGLKPEAATAEPRSSTPVDSAREAKLASWRGKLDHLELEEAIVSDAGQKWTIKKAIEEARIKIRELGGKATAPTPPPADRPPRKSAENMSKISDLDRPASPKRPPLKRSANILATDHEADFNPQRCIGSRASQAPLGVFDR